MMMQYFNRIVEACMPSFEVCADRETRQRFRFNISLIIPTILIIVAYGPIHHMAGNYDVWYFTFSCVVSAGVSLLYGRSTGNLLAMANGFVFCGFLSVVGGFWVSGMGESPIVFLIVIPPFSATLVANTRSAIVWSFVSLLTVIATFFYSYHVPPHRLPSVLERYFFYTIVIGTFVFVAVYYSEKFHKLKEDSIRRVEDRNKVIRRIVENVKSGILLVDSNLTIQPGYSTSCEKLFGTTELAQRNFLDLLTQDARARDFMNCCYAEAFRDTLPGEVYLGQAPQDFDFNNRHLNVQGSIVRDKENKVENLLFTISDATKVRQLEEKTNDQSLLLFVVNNRMLFSEFISQCEMQFESIGDAVKTNNNAELLLILHALKGSCGVFGFKKLTKMIHDFESVGSMTLSDVEKLEGTVDEEVKRVCQELSIERSKLDSLAPNITQESLAELEKILQSPNMETQLSAARAWLLQAQQIPIGHLLETYGVLVTRLGQQFQKPARMTFSGDNPSVSPDLLRPILVHVPNLIRNTFAHGIESPWERGDKDVQAHVSIVCEMKPGKMILTFSDDGRGIQLDELKEAAVRKGILSSEDAQKISEHDAFQLVFSPGLSTASSVNDIAGRGVGLAGLKQAAVELGGTTVAFSTPGESTQIRVEIPVANPVSKAA